MCLKKTLRSSSNSVKHSNDPAYTPTIAKSFRPDKTPLELISVAVNYVTKLM